MDHEAVLIVFRYFGAIGVKPEHFGGSTLFGLPLMGDSHNVKTGHTMFLFCNVVMQESSLELQQPRRETQSSECRWR